MLKSQLDFIVKSFGDSSLPDSEKWKCLKYIYIENPLLDVQSALKDGTINFVDNSNLGPGFYILGSPNAEFGIVGIDERVVTFIPLSIIDKVSILTDYIKKDSTPDDDDPWGDIVDKIDMLKDMLIINDEEVDELIKASDYKNHYLSNDEFMTIIE